MNKIAFDGDKFLKMQKEEILKRKKFFGGKLYIEVGGKLFDDFHAERVLPGYNPNNKVKLLETLKDDLEVVFCISAKDIEKNKIRADFGITYGQETLRLIGELRGRKILVNSVVITMFNNETSAIKFSNILKNNNIKVYFHKVIPGYPTDVKTIVSEKGYGLNDYITTTKPIVVVAAPGPGSGKLSTCLSQLYHEKKNGVLAGYAKFETFPVWNLPLSHPLNVAYESATADLNDINVIDPYHFERYGKVAVNYNRDIATFPVLREILRRIYGKDIYFSPTDTSINMIGYCIKDESLVEKACDQELVRRYLKAKVDLKKGLCLPSTLEKQTLLLKKMNLSVFIRPCVKPALAKEKKTNVPCMAIELKDGKIITGKTTDALSASASVILNALKNLAGILDKFKLISYEILKPLTILKSRYLNDKTKILNLRDVLIALSICATTNDMAKKALSMIPNLVGTNAHSSKILSPDDETTFRKLKIDVTSEDEFADHKTFGF